MHGGREVFNEFFPRDESDRDIDKQGDPFMSNGRYVVRIKNENFKLQPNARLRPPGLHQQPAHADDDAHFYDRQQAYVPARGG